MNHVQTHWHIDREEEVNYRQAIEQTGADYILVGKGLLAVHGPFCQKISYPLENNASPHCKILGGENNLGTSGISNKDRYTRNR